MKQPKEWYDDVFKNGVYWNEHSENFYPLWDEIWRVINSGGYDRIIDLGCGPGLFLKRNPEAVIDYLGVDFSPYAVEKVNEMGFDAIIMDLETETPDYSYFNCVVMCEVLEHIENDIELINSVPEGVAIVGSVPMFDDESHVRYFSGIKDVRDRYKKNFKQIYTFEKRIIFEI
jgi:SAM-dependent methyltransferase